MILSKLEKRSNQLYVPTRVFFTKGVGRHKEYLSSFEAALRNAGIEICNL
ncbi:MAG: pyruvoyl-dependent arginine decarboxylase, partial [Bacteroidetes bacterium]|nr:pyruvoyl-dependent arginine decarboxylase [Bacteroidota bacterium]